MLDSSPLQNERPAAIARLLSDVSLELPVAKVAAFTADPKRFAPGSQVFLPHLPGGDADGLGAACRCLVERGFEPVPHVAGRHLASEGALAERLRAAAENGAKSLLVLAGDRDRPAGPYGSAYDLLAAPCFRDFAFERAMISGYPEGHSAIDRPALAAAMRRKIEILNRFGMKTAIVTQFAFDPQAYVTWVQALRAAGIDRELRLGVAGVTALPTLLKYAVACGIGPSLSILRKRGGALMGMLGGYDPGPLVQEIASRLDGRAAGPIGLHLYPFGGAEKSLDWLASLRGDAAR